MKKEKGSGGKSEEGRGGGKGEVEGRFLWRFCCVLVRT